jgi:hypothetical protein
MATYQLELAEVDEVNDGDRPLGGLNLSFGKGDELREVSENII